jgi:hypothetical protein
MTTAHYNGENFVMYPMLALLCFLWVKFHHILDVALSASSFGGRLRIPT